MVPSSMVCLFRSGGRPVRSSRRHSRTTFSWVLQVWASHRLGPQLHLLLAAYHRNRALRWLFINRAATPLLCGLRCLARTIILTSSASFVRMLWLLHIIAPANVLIQPPLFVLLLSCSLLLQLALFKFSFLHLAFFVSSLLLLAVLVSALVLPPFFLRFAVLCFPPLIFGPSAWFLISPLSSVQNTVALSKTVSLTVPVPVPVPVPVSFHISVPIAIPIPVPIPFPISFPISFFTPTPVFSFSFPVSGPVSISVPHLRLRPRTFAVCSSPAFAVHERHAAHSPLPPFIRVIALSSSLGKLTAQSRHLAAPPVGHRTCRILA
mmetsp:Transcript_45486/g.120677  ORF Transcript_45486/g.120677 Transcript_45486/m.120677 type:complete len:321 (-) Transcript_45486:355-1317(-)